jgi:hypothetical protein
MNIGAMERAVATGDRAEIARNPAEEIVYTVGAQPPRHGTRPFWTMLRRKAGSRGGRATRPLPPGPSTAR